MKSQLKKIPGITRVGSPLLRLSRALYNHGTVEIHSVDSKSLIPVRATVNCRIELQQDPNDDRHLRLMRRIYAYRPAYAEECAESGGRCYIADLDGEVIGVAWLTGKKLTLDALGWHEVLKPGTELIHSCGVHPDLRGHRVFPALLYQVARERLSAGADAIWVEVDRRNTPSRRGIERVGFRPTRAIHWHLVFGRAWAIQRPT